MTKQSQFIIINDVGNGLKPFPTFNLNKNLTVLQYSKSHKYMEVYILKKFEMILIVWLCLNFLFFSACIKETSVSPGVEAKVDPTTVLWYQQPADKWENAVPVGNGRLGAMVHGRTDREEIQFNEDTHWSGGPYSTVVKGGYKHLPEVQKLIFAGEYIEAHKLFGRYLMGNPVEQQKYQATGRLWLNFKSESEVENYRHELDLATAISTLRMVSAIPVKFFHQLWIR